MNTTTRTLNCFVAGLILLACTTLHAQKRTTTYSNIDIKTVVPVLSVETTGPSDINLGKTATYTITVKNVGDSPAEGVIARTSLPGTVEFQNSTPKAEAIQDGNVRIYVGDLPAKSSRRIILNLIPKKQGPVDLVTKVSFSTSTKSSLRVRKSNLKIRSTGPAKANYGQTVSIKIVVTNNGDGPAEDVNILPHVPDSVLSDGDSVKPMKLGILPAGQSREMLYTVKAKATGSLDLKFEVFDATGAKTESRSKVRVLRPILNVSITGPTLRYIRRAGDYQISVTNPGDAPVTDVEVVAAVPSGLHVIAIAKAAKYDKDAKTLTWYLPSVDPGTETILSLKSMATEVGEQVHQVVASNKAGMVANAERVTHVVSRPNLYATVINDDGATEVYQPAAFTVLIANRGSSAARGVEIAVELPDGLEGLPSDELAINGTQLKFEPINLEVGEQKELHFQAVSRVAGDHTVRVSYRGDNMSRALTVEGDAFYYDDEQPGRIPEKLETIQTGGPQLVPR